MFAEALLVVISNILVKGNQVSLLGRFSKDKNLGNEIIDDFVDLLSILDIKFSNLSFESRGSSDNIVRGEG